MRYEGKIRTRLTLTNISIGTGWPFDTNWETNKDLQPGKTWGGLTGERSVLTTNRDELLKQLKDVFSELPRRTRWYTNKQISK